MTIKCTLKIKLAGLKYNYGPKACKYFIDNHACENCLENRLVLLNIHHTHGKSEDNFMTLCFNCHMLEHNENNASTTYEDCMIRDEEKNKIKSQKDDYILKKLKEGLSIGKIIKICNTSFERVKKIMKENGFECEPRRKQRKIS